MYDQRILTAEAYADDAKLDVRYRTHKLFTVNPVDFGRWTLERLAWRGDERVLDVGCAHGDLLREMALQNGDWGALVGFDLSAGMIDEALRQRGGDRVLWFVGDAQRLPFPAAIFDVVMARHMLYHVPDIVQAVKEAARVLLPGGHFLAVTNSAHTMPEYHAILDRAALRFPGIGRSLEAAGRFSLENGASLLAPHFDSVETHILEGTLRFPAPQPFLDYVGSSRALIMRPGSTDQEWQEVLDYVRAETESIIGRHGCLDVTKITGALTGIVGT
jgi:SAM-dependent methyltransferase